MEQNKTRISAQIVADSKNQQGDRITSVLVTFPRIILAELNTHRMLSKNSASSRAIPFNKMVEAVQNNPFIPIAWQKDHKGMQGTEYWTDDDTVTVGEGDEYERYTKIYSATEHFITEWLEARDLAIAQSYELNRLGVTKQLCNRLLEPFMWHTVIVTATEWENFFKLRCPQYVIEGINGNHPFRSKKDVYKRMSSNENFMLKLNDFTDLDWLSFNKSQAEIHIQVLAEAMWDAMNESIPKTLQSGQWHIPFEDKIRDQIHVGGDGLTLEQLQDEDLVVKISTAMCARTSYTIVGDEKEFSYEKQIALHDRMANAVPFHASPFEHCARAMSNYEYQSFVKGYTLPIDDETNYRNTLCEGWCRNYKGFIQYRELLEKKK